LTEKAHSVCKNAAKGNFQPGPQCLETSEYQQLLLTDVKLENISLGIFRWCSYQNGQ